MDEIANVYLKGKEVVKSLTPEDYEVIGIAAVCCMLTNTAIGVTLGGVVAGIVIGLFIRKKI